MAISVARFPSAPDPIRRCAHARVEPMVLIFAVLLTLGGSHNAKGQSDSLAARTVTVEYEVYAGNKTPVEAREVALERAQAEAVRQAIGTEVRAERSVSTIETGDEVVDRFSQVVRTGASGRVVEYDLLSEERLNRGGRPFLRVQIRATVQPSRGRPDPAFSVDLHLTDDDRTFVARNPLRESDEIIAEIETTKDAYITLFSITPDTLQVLWPNALSQDTRVSSNTPVQFPAETMRARGLHLRVDLPEDRTHITERLVAVATKEKIPFQSVPQYQVESGTLTTAAASMQAFNRWLVKIPLGDRALSSVTYDVTEPPDR